MHLVYYFCESTLGCSGVSRVTWSVLCLGLISWVVPYTRQLWVWCTALVRTWTGPTLDWTTAEHGPGSGSELLVEARPVHVQVWQKFVWTGLELGIGNFSQNGHRHPISDFGQPKYWNCWCATYYWGSLGWGLCTYIIINNHSEPQFLCAGRSTVYNLSPTFLQTNASIRARQVTSTYFHSQFHVAGTANWSSPWSM
jgi:hypothetical protein